MRTRTRTACIFIRAARRGLSAKGLAAYLSSRRTRGLPERTIRTCSKRRSRSWARIPATNFSSSANTGGSISAQNPTLHRAREICDILLDRYTAGELNEIFVVYTDFGGGRSEHVYVTRLLPLSRGEFGAYDGKHVQFEYEPSVSVVLDNVIHSYVSGFVYSALVDSYCCEQNARMVAMLGADNNAEEILSITQEITEVTSGAKSMKRKGADQ